MQINIVKNIVQRTPKNLLNPLFVHKSKVYKDGASQLFSAIVTTGSVLIKDIAERLNEKNVSMKGCQEKVSGWLDRYDFATPSRRKFGIPGVLSCQWILLLRLMQATSLRIRRIWHGGDGVGHDASRKVTAMGHSLLSAITVTHKRTIPLCVNLEKGRKGLPEKEILLFDEIIKSVGDKGILVHDRGFDNTVFISHAYHSKHRSVERMRKRARFI